MKGKERRHVFFQRSSFIRSDEPAGGLIILGDTGGYTEDVSGSITAQESILVMFRHEILFFLDA